MRKHIYSVVIAGILLASPLFVRGGPGQRPLKPEFHTSDRCVACHNGMRTKSGEDISIGFDWRASMMANSARDPYWQGSVRRESLDHPESKPVIENECSVCHMPIIHLQAQTKGRQAEIFAHLPFNPDNKDNAAAEDGVSCSVCHQIAKEKLGTRESFNGAFAVDIPESDDPLRYRRRTPARDAVLYRWLSAYAGRSCSRVGDVRYLPHVVHPISRAKRKRDRHFPRADAVP